MLSRIAFSTLAFPDATLAAAVSAGRRWGYSGVELRLIDGELIDPAMPAERRAQVRRTLAAAGQGLVLAHENEKEIFGDTPDLQVKDALAATGEVVPRARATGRCGKPWPRCGTRASRASCRWNRTWPGRAATAGSADPTASLWPPDRSN